jgi:lysylphosphatidylglycerol synthetase-like protein (DUF2156 family)
MTSFINVSRNGNLRLLGGVMRALLTFTAVADLLLAFQAWTFGPHHPHVHDSAGQLALVALTSVKLLAAVILAAAALYLATRPKRAFQRILLLLTVLAAVLAVAAAQPTLIAIAVGDCFAALLAVRLWPEIGDTRSSRAGWFLLCTATGLTAWLFLLQRPNHRMAFLFTLLLALAFVAVVSALALLDRNPAVPAGRDPATARLLYEDHALSGVAPFALMAEKRQFWAHDHLSFLAFGCRAGTALALGPAIGPSSSTGDLQEEFRAVCRRRGWRPAFYQVSRKAADDLPATVRLNIGSEAFVELEGFGLEGPKMAKLRRDVARAQREGVSVEILPEAALSPELRGEMRRIHAETGRRQPLGEMSFSVGQPDDAPPVERTVGLAYDREGRPTAYVTWLWVPATATMVLDEVNRQAGAPPGAMDLLIATSLQEFRGKAVRASLGLAPITGGSQAARLEVAEIILRKTLGINSLAPGVYSFKAKFNPTWEQRYLVVESALDLPAVLLATFLLHYPELTRRLQRLSRPRLART